MAEHDSIEGPTFAEELSRHPDLRIDTWWTSGEFWIEEFGLPALCARIEEGTKTPADVDPFPLSVAVERDVGECYGRWCDF